MNLTKNFASRRQSWRDSRQDHTEIFATMNLLLGENLGKIRGRIPARFWPRGLLLPGENHGEIRGRIVPRFWPLGFLPFGENLDVSSRGGKVLVTNERVSKNFRQ